MTIAVLQMRWSAMEGRIYIHMDALREAWTSFLNLLRILVPCPQSLQPFSSSVRSLLTLL